MRIISGKFGSRNLLSPPRGSSARPFTGLAKKSVFSILEPIISGAVVADIFCGTGTFGLEAISRGASQCLFFDRDGRVISRLNRNIAELGVSSQCDVCRGDIFSRLSGFIASRGLKIDIAMVDPPFESVRTWQWSMAAESIFNPICKGLSDDGVVLLRTPADVTPDDESLGGLMVRRKKAYGGMSVFFLEKQLEQECPKSK